MSGRILVDGREDLKLDARDRGLQYGDGLFETMAVIDGRVRRLEAHLARLREGCLRLGIPAPDPALLSGEIAGLVAGNPRAVLKLILTRGAGGRGYQPPPEPTPTRVLWLDTWPQYPQEWEREGVAVRLCRTILSEQPLLAGIKHLNRLEQVLARREWRQTSAGTQVAEGLMQDASGAVVCGTMTNLFVVHNGRLLTPSVERCGVAGTVRHAVLQAAVRDGMEAVETRLDAADLERAEEVFLTNSLIGVWPVRRIEGRSYDCGPITRRLQGAI